MSLRQQHHFVIRYEYRLCEENLGTLAEERQLSQQYGIQSPRYERWAEETLAMSFSIRRGDEAAKAAAAKHFLKMVIRKRGGRANVRIRSFSMDAQEAQSYYETHLAPELD